MKISYRKKARSLHFSPRRKIHNWNDTIWERFLTVSNVSQIQIWGLITKIYLFPYNHIILKWKILKMLYRPTCTCVYYQKLSTVLTWLSKLQENVAQNNVCVVRYLKKGLIKAWSLTFFFNWVRNYLFLKNYVTSKGAVSHIVLYYSVLTALHC